MSVIFSPISSPVMELVGGLEIRPDWVRCSFRGDDAVNRAKAMFGGSDGLSWTELGRGMWTYAACLVRGGVRIYHESRVDDGKDICTVEVSGSACRQLEAEGVVTSWQSFCKKIAKHCCNVARFDVSFDAHGLSWGTMREAISSGAVLSRFRCPAERISGLDKQGRDTGRGETYMWGHSSSDQRLRVYDKAAEQLQEEKNWVRLELQTQNQRANSVVGAIAERGLKAALGHLAALWDLRKGNPDDTNRSRSPRLDWWSALVDNAEACRITIQKQVVRSIEKSADWLMRQCARSLALVTRVKGEDFVNAMLFDGGRRIDAEQRALVQQADLWEHGVLSMA